MEIQSRVGTIQANQQKVYSLLADFNNLAKFVPHDKVADFKSDTDSCSFTVDTIGKFGMRIIEREPAKLVKIANDENVPFQFKMWVQLVGVNDLETLVRVTLKADLNPMVKMVAQKPLTTFVETLVDKLELIR